MMSRSIIILFCAVFMACPLLAQNVDESTMQKQADIINSALSYYNSGNYERAIQIFTTAINEAPTSLHAATAYHFIGNIYHNNLNDLETAVSNYARAINIDSNVTNGFTRYCRGSIYLTRGQYKLAVKDFTHAIVNKENPRMLASYFDRAASYHNLGKFQQAIKDYSKVIELEPSFNSGRAFYNRADAYAELKQYDMAIADYTRALDFDPDKVKIYMDRGAALQNSGRNKAAIGEYKKALAITNDPKIRQFAENNLEKMKSGVEDEKLRAAIPILMTQWGESLDKASRAMHTRNFSISDKFVNKCLSLTAELRNVYYRLGVPKEKIRFIDGMDMMTTVFVNMGEIVSVDANPTGKKNDLNATADLVTESYKLIRKAAVYFNEAGMPDLANVCNNVENELTTVIRELEERLGCRIM